VVGSPGADHVPQVADLTPKDVAVALLGSPAVVPGAKGFTQAIEELRLLWC
jgi:hypothetical protein